MEKPKAVIVMCGSCGEWIDAQKVGVREVSGGTAVQCDKCATFNRIWLIPAAPKVPPLVQIAWEARKETPEQTTERRIVQLETAVAALNRRVFP